MNAKNLPRPYTSHIWTDAMIARLRAIYNGELSASQMADILNTEFGTQFTRNAIIGKSHRLCLDADQELVRKRRAEQARKAYVKYREKQLKQRRLTLVHPEPDPPKPVVLEERPVKTAPGTLLVDLQAYQCRWPINDPPKGQPYLFCDDRKARGSSYCIKHSRLAWPNKRVYV